MKNYKFRNALRYGRYKRKNIGEFVDADWYYGYQCVDLIRHYCREAYNYNMGKLPQAKLATLSSTFPWRIEVKVWFDDIWKWDVIVRWPKGNNKAGHIAIVENVTNDWPLILEQNGVWWGTMRPWNEVRLRQTKRGNILKVFRPNNY